MSTVPEIYQLKIRLLGIRPMIWRRVLAPASTTLRELHGVLQVAMGWEGIHLFLFDVYAVRYGIAKLFCVRCNWLTGFGYPKFNS